MQELFESLNQQTGITFLHLAESLVIVILAILLWHLISTLFLRNRKRINNSDRKTRVSAVHMIYNLGKYILALVVFFVILKINGVNVNAMIASLGLISAIIGLALQDEIKDIIMGIHLMADNFFKVGDVIVYNGITGKVISYSLKAVQIESIYDNSITTICNRNITEVSVLSNVVDIDVPIGYWEDTHKVREMMEQCCEAIDQNDDIVTCLFMGTQEFAASCINYRLRFFVAKPEKIPALRRFAFGKVQDVLELNGIDIPFSVVEVVQGQH